MLEPDSRSLLSELLRPPSGFTLSHAVGTTFTLSLEAALAVPLSLAGSGGSGDDAAGILSAVRRSTDRIDLFAQTGYIGLGTASELVAVLEPMIHPVSMPAGRLFHPKVWFLEFASGDERRYRFVCSSRNLTTDRTWDAVVALDGDPGDAADEANDDMVRMLRWLASDGRTTPQLPGARRARLLDLAESWRSIRWEHPEHVRRVAVHVLGIGGDAPPVLDGIRALIVSPFVTDSGLARLRARPGRPTTLVSRPEQLDRLAPASFDHLSMHVLDEFVDQALADAETETGTAQATGLVGLHAKMMVHDRAMGGSTVFLGSANATGPAWVSNVEVMVQLDGSTKQLGVDAITQSLAPLLDEYETEGGATASEDEAAERDLDSALRTIATARLTLRVHPGEPYAASLWAADPVPRVPDGLSLSWRLLTRTDARNGTFPTAGIRRGLVGAVASGEVVHPPSLCREHPGLSGGFTRGDGVSGDGSRRNARSDSSRAHRTTPRGRVHDAQDAAGPPNGARW